MLVSSNVPMAVYCPVWPSSIDAVAGIMTIATSVGGSGIGPSAASLIEIEKASFLRGDSNAEGGLAQRIPSSHPRKPGGLWKLAAERVWRRVRPELRIRSRDDRHTTGEEIGQRVDCIGNVQLTGIVGVCGIQARKEGTTNEKVIQRKEGIGDVDRAISVRIPA